MSRAIDQASKKAYQLVKFRYGPDHATGEYSYAAYTNWTEDIPGSPTYESTPTLRVNKLSNVGTLENKTVTILLPADTFANRISTGLPVEPIKVEIRERIVPVDPGDQATTLFVFKGKLKKVTRNPNGKRGVVEVLADSYKNHLDVPLGLPANPQCPWIYGKSPCGAFPDNATSGVTISAIDGKKITVAGLREVPAYDDRNFHRGYILRHGIKIGIREWRDSDYFTFYLVRQPPASWSGQEIKIYAGCDKTIETCRLRGSEETFGGFGYAIPPYNPLIEEGGGERS